MSRRGRSATARRCTCADLADTDGYRSGERPSVHGRGSRRAHRRSAVPLVHAGRAIGAISVHRREVRRYTDDEIELVQSFAAQAVIAIENARQFAQTQQALVRETASADILRVISRSTADIQPVFDLIARKAAELCGAQLLRAGPLRRREASLLRPAWLSGRGPRRAHGDLPDGSEGGLASLSRPSTPARWCMSRMPSATVISTRPSRRPWAFTT